MMNTWLLASRPKTLLAAFVPVMLGTALARTDGHAILLRAFVALIGAFLIQIGTNFFNDYADFKLGADTEARKGPTRAVASGLIPPRSMLIASCLVFALSLGCSGLLAYWAGWPMLLLGLVSVACGFWYTAGRWSLAYLGLGEIFVVLFFGLVATAGTYYVQAEALPTYAWVAGFCPGFLATCLIVVNNWRDIEEDRAAQKKTLAARFGPGFAATEFILCLAAGALTPLALSLVYPVSPLARILFAVIPIFCAVILILKRWRPGLRGRELVPFLGLSAGLMLLVNILFSVGVLLP